MRTTHVLGHADKSHHWLTQQKRDHPIKQQRVRPSRDGHASSRIQDQEHARLPNHSTAPCGGNKTNFLTGKLADRPAQYAQAVARPIGQARQVPEVSGKGRWHRYQFGVLANQVGVGVVRGMLVSKMQRWHHDERATNPSKPIIRTHRSESRAVRALVLGGE